MFANAGIANVRLNEIVAFTPTAATLRGIAKGLETPPSGQWSRLSISERIYLEPTGWERHDGLPSRSRSPAHYVLAKAQGSLALRLLRDGTSTIMRSREVHPDDLVADMDECIPEATNFAKASLVELSRQAGDQELEWPSLAMDEQPELSMPLDRQPPYPIVEIELTGEDRLRRLVRGETDQMQHTLDDLLMYLVARNYRLSRADGVTLEQVCGEVLPDVLDDGLLLHEVANRKRLRNLSQGTRIFIAFARRGAVLVHTPAIMSLPIRCSVINMVETLRGRVQNLIVASALMDGLLLRLAQLVELPSDRPVSDDETHAVKTILRELATATYTYGLSVTDPGAQLLDGSIISIIADRAEVYFESQSLRHACNRKMDAIRTIWATYQDRRRQTLMRALQSMAPSGAKAT